MRKTLVLFFCLLFLIGFSSCAQIKFSENPDAIEKASESVVEINIYDSQNDMIASGSGFFIFDSKTIVTNYHVIEDAYRIEIVDYCNNTTVATQIRNVDKSKDLAILIVEDIGNAYTPLNIRVDDELKKGETVVAIGNPLGLKNTVSTGTISNFTKTDGIDMIQFTASISSGSSGGALFDDFGNIIGVTSMTFVDGQNLNLAIPSGEVLDLYNKTPIAETIIDFFDRNKPYINEPANSSDSSFIEWDAIKKSAFLHDHGGDFETSFFNIGKKDGEFQACQDNRFNYGYQEGYKVAVEEYKKKYPLLDIIISNENIQLFEIPEYDNAYEMNRSKAFSLHDSSVPSEYYSKCKEKFYSGYDESYKLFFNTYEYNELQPSYESAQNRGYQFGYSQFTDNIIADFKTQYPILSFFVLLNSVVLFVILLTIIILVFLIVLLLNKKRTKEQL